MRTLSSGLASSILLGGVLLASACETRGSREICNDGIDNNGDRRIDCADSMCVSSPSCVATDAGDAGTERVDAYIEGVDALVTDTNLISDCGPLDVVFVLDVSTSMGEAIGSLRSGIRDVWDAASRLSPAARFSLIVFVDDALAVNACAPFASVEALSASFDQWQTFCSSNQSPLSRAENFDFPENSLDALQLAVNACTFRAGATRIVVHVTDDTFLEPPSRFSGAIPAQYAFNEVSTNYVTNELRLASFHDVARYPQGFSAPYAGAPGLVEATNGASFSLGAVVAGDLNMGTAIQGFIEEEYCTPFIF